MSDSYTKFNKKMAPVNINRFDNEKCSKMNNFTMFAEFRFNDDHEPKPKGWEREIIGYNDDQGWTLSIIDGSLNFGRRGSTVDLGNFSF